MTTALATKSIQTATITLEAAVALVKAAQAAAKMIGFEAAIAVTDLAGNLKVFERADQCPFLAVEVAIDKAWTAASFGLGTHTWAEVIQNPRVSQLAHRPRLVAVGGGCPVMENGKVIGAIGVSGGNAEQDQRAAEIALQEVGFLI
jgi:uncharacterized protein GlcG (DUF336 family)